RKLRYGERRRDPGLLLPDQPVARAQHSAVGQPVGDSQPRSEVEFMQFARGLRESVLPQIFELLRLKIEDRSLIAGFLSPQVQRVAQPGVDSQARRHFETVLREEFQDAGARVNHVLLQVY